MTINEQLSNFTSACVNCVRDMFLQSHVKCSQCMNVIVLVCERCSMMMQFVTFFTQKTSFKQFFAQRSTMHERSATIAFANLASGGGVACRQAPATHTAKLWWPLGGVVAAKSW